MKERIRSVLLELGADVCGVANIDRFAQSPEGCSPIDLFAQCQSVVVFGKALPKGLTAVSPRLIYGHYNYQSCAYVDRITFEACKKIEQQYACKAVPLPCDSPYEQWDPETLTGHGLLSLKHAAVQAGLGCMGKNTLLLNETYGNLLTLGAILLDIPLESDPIRESFCIEHCHKCVASCPSGALTAHHVDQKLCRLYTYGKTSRGFDTVDCNACRTGCPMRFGKPAGAENCKR